MGQPEHNCSIQIIRSVTRSATDFTTKKAAMDIVRLFRESCVLYVTFLLFSPVYSQFDLAPEIPSHLPAPPKPSPPPSNSGNATGTAQGSPGDLPPPQNVPVGPLGPGVLPPDFAPFGLQHIILIIVPQFKTKFHKLPAWVASSIKISMPITVFFDQLDVPPEMLLPGAGLFPPFPLGIPPPPIMRPPGPGPMPVPVSPGFQNASTLPATDQQSSAYYGYYSHKPYLYGYDEDTEDADGDTEGYENDSYYSEEERSFSQRRRKRESCLSHSPHDNINKRQFYVRNKRAVTFNHTTHKSERASLMPKFENILNSAGMEGRPCMLRAVCEVHEASLNHYGLVGELLTLFFSVSRSIFAETHLPEYVRAEEAGKTGDCTEFQRQCDNTMFSWEEIAKESHLTNEL